MSTLGIQHHGFDGGRGALDATELQCWEDDNITVKTTSSAVTVKRSNVTEFVMNKQNNNDKVNDRLAAPRAQFLALSAQFRAQLRAQGLTEQEIDQVTGIVEEPQQQRRRPAVPPQPAQHAPQQPAQHVPQQPPIPHQLNLGDDHEHGSLNSSLTEDHDHSVPLVAAANPDIPAQPAAAARPRNADAGSLASNGLMREPIGSFGSSAAACWAAQEIDAAGLLEDESSVQNMYPFSFQQAPAISPSSSARQQRQQSNGDDQDGVDGNRQEEKKEEVSPETGTGTGHEELDRKQPAAKKPRLS